MVQTPLSSLMQSLKSEDTTPAQREGNIATQRALVEHLHQCALVVATPGVVQTPSPPPINPNADIVSSYH
jgi:hypothetical protein